MMVGLPKFPQHPLQTRTLSKARCGLSSVFTTPPGKRPEPLSFLLLAGHSGAFLPGSEGPRPATWWVQVGRLLLARLCWPIDTQARRWLHARARRMLLRGWHRAQAV